MMDATLTTQRGRSKGSLYLVVARQRREVQHREGARVRASFHGHARAHQRLRGDDVAVDHRTVQRRVAARVARRHVHRVAVPHQQLDHLRDSHGDAAAESVVGSLVRASAVVLEV